jgi:heat shock protein HslJ
MKRKTTLTAITFCMLILLTSCNPTISLSMDALDDKPGNTPLPSDNLAGTSWTLLSFNKTSLIEGTSFTLAFSDDQVSGNGGCNQFFAAYRMNEDQISIEGIGMTDMACLEPDGVMEQEFVILEILSEVERFELYEGCLQLYRGDGEALSFSPVFE